MGYKSLEACVLDLERHGHLVRIREEVDPYLEMAAIHLRVFEHGGPAVFFERVKGSRFPAVSNLFGTLERSRFVFRDTLERVKALVDLKYDPMRALRAPLRYLPAARTATSALPRRQRRGAPVRFGTARVGELPQIVNWPMDGGPFVTLPQVYTEDPDRPGVMGSNLGMYRVQLAGNEYAPDREVGLHYQIHRGIGVHHAGGAAGEPLRVNVFVGGPPAHDAGRGDAAARKGCRSWRSPGRWADRAFRYFHDEAGHCVSADADFVITGTVDPRRDPAPRARSATTWATTAWRTTSRCCGSSGCTTAANAIWPFTVVGRPPQEDTSFGALIHELTGPSAIPHGDPGGPRGARGRRGRRAPAAAGHRQRALRPLRRASAARRSC